MHKLARQQKCDPPSEGCAQLLALHRDRPFRVAKRVRSKQRSTPQGNPKSRSALRHLSVPVDRYAIDLRGLLLHPAFGKQIAPPDMLG